MLTATLADLLAARVQQQEAREERVAAIARTLHEKARADTAAMIRAHEEKANAYAERKNRFRLREKRDRLVQFILAASTMRGGKQVARPGRKQEIADARANVREINATLRFPQPEPPYVRDPDYPSGAMLRTPPSGYTITHMRNEEQRLTIFANRIAKREGNSPRVVRMFTHLEWMRSVLVRRIAKSNMQVRKSGRHCYTYR